MQREFISFPKSGRSWVRYTLVKLGLAKYIAFHHDGFEYNDGTRPPLDFDFEARLARYKESVLVYMHRDPRDVMVSLYFQVTGRFSDFFQYQGTISEFIRDPYFGATNLREFQRQWELICTKGLALKISYEECHCRFEDVIQRVVKHYDLTADSREIAHAAVAASFPKMQKLERSGKFDEPWLRLRNNAPKVRRGLVGGFRDVLTTDDCDFLNSVFGLQA